MVFRIFDRIPLVELWLRYSHEVFIPNPRFFQGGIKITFRIKFFDCAKCSWQLNPTFVLFDKVNSVLNSEQEKYNFFLIDLKSMFYCLEICSNF